MGQRLQASSSCWHQSQSRLLNKIKRLNHQDSGWAQAQNQLLKKSLLLGSGKSKQIFNHGATSTDLTFKSGPLIKHEPLSKATHGHGFLAKKFLIERGSGLMRSTCYGSGLSLETDYQDIGSQVNLTVRNPKEFFKGRQREEERFSGHARRQISAGLLAKMKPKLVSNFAHGNIASGLNEINADKKISRRRGSCSLHVSSNSNSPDSLSTRNKNKFLPSAYRVCFNELDVTADFVEPSRIINDFELDSDGEGLHSYMPLCSSSEDEEGEDGEEPESQTFEAYEVQEENQKAIFDDIRFLFNKYQETKVNAIQLTEEEKKGYRIW